METKNIVEEFFRRRFPKKDLKFEIECGYFDTWVRRFNSENPEEYMDDESSKVWKQMQKEGIKHD